MRERILRIETQIQKLLRQRARLASQKRGRKRDELRGLQLSLVDATINDLIKKCDELKALEAQSLSRKN